MKLSKALAARRAQVGTADAPQALGAVCLEIVAMAVSTRGSERRIRSMMMIGPWSSSGRAIGPAHRGHRWVGTEQCQNEQCRW